jgi:Phosphate-starvation-inducible E family
LTLHEQRLVAEPFLLVGIIAAIKELVLLSGTEDLRERGFEQFRNGMIEIGVVVGVVLVLSICTLLLRRSRREPSELDE